MSSPRKMASGPASPRGVSLPPVKTTQNSPRGGEKLDSSQLTPRRRQKMEIHSGRDHLQGLLPNKISSKSLVEMAAASRPKAAPRSHFEQGEEDEQPKKKSSDSLSIPNGGRYGNRGGGDGLLRLPIEGLSKMDIKDELKHGKKPMTYGYGFDKEEGEEDSEDGEEPPQNEDVMEQDRARFNVWKGTNYELHLLGDFKSDFEKRVKSFQRPTTEPITMDPFCRNESGLLDEPPKSDAFLVWKSKPHLKWTGINEKEPPISSPFTSSSGESAGEEVDIYECDENDDDGDSLPDPEMNEYILAQQQKREEGESPTGETLYYDEDFDMVRNLHRDSYSLTNYGVMPDDKWIGKAHLFYPEMTEAEKKMLRVPERKPVPLSPRYAVGRRINK